MRLYFRLMRDYFHNERKYRGKHRKPFPVDGLQKAALVRDIQREEKNMFLLRHPYLNEEQAKHLEDLKRDVEAKAFENKAIAAYKYDKRPNYHIEQHLGHLRHGDSWDV